MTRAKNRIHGVLRANLIALYWGELFSAAGRLWLKVQPLAQDEKLAIRRYLADRGRPSERHTNPERPLDHADREPRLVVAKPTAAGTCAAARRAGASA
jgi:hypothetical protein